MNTVVKEQQINLNGFIIRYFTAGEDGLPLVLLHGNAASAIDWSWVLPKLANQYRVYAPDFPGFGDSSKPNLNYSLDFLTQFVGDFLNALNIEKAVLAGNSLGGIVALRFALSNSDRVASLVLVDSSGLGYAVTPLLSQLTLPGYGEIMIAGCKTPLGAKPRSWLRATLLFTHPGKVPAVWIAEQERMSLLPGFLEASLSALRAQLNFIGQREVLLDTLSQLTIPTLVVWGTNDSVFPKYQAETAVSRLQQGQIALIPDCGHLPHVERPDLFSNAVSQFLVEVK